MPTTIEPYCAPSVFNPPTYSQAVKVTGAQTILFTSPARSPTTTRAGPRIAATSPPRRARCSRRSRRRWRPAAAPCDNIVKINTYLTDIRHRADLVPDPRGVLRQEGAGLHAGGRGRARQPEWLIEIEAIAVI